MWSRVRRFWYELRLNGRINTAGMRAIDVQLDSLDVPVAARRAARAQIRLRIDTLMSKSWVHIPPSLPLDQIEDFIREGEQKIAVAARRATVEHMRTRGSQ